MARMGDNIKDPQPGLTERPPSITVEPRLLPPLLRGTSSQNLSLCEMHSDKGDSSTLAARWGDQSFKCPQITLVPRFHGHF